MVSRKKSIQYKLVRVILITSAATLLVTFTSYFIYEYFSYRQTMHQQLTTLSQIIATNSTAALAFDDVEDATEILTALKAEEDIIQACLYDKNGVLFAKYPDSLSTNQFPVRPASIGYRFYKGYLEVYDIVQEGGMHLGTIYLNKSMRSMHQRFTLYTLIGALVMTLCFVLAYILSKQLQKGISTPIIALAKTTRLVSEYHDYTIRAHKYSDDEIGLLTDAFNNMLQQIDIQNKEIEHARKAAQLHAKELEIKVNERTIEYRKQKDFAEEILNSSLVLILVIDKDTRIISFNNKCEEEFQLKKEQVLGRKIVDVLPRIKNSLTYSSLLRSLNGVTIHNEQYKSSVTGKYYESYMLPLKTENNEVYAVLVTAHNITPIVESTEKLKQTNIELLRRNADLEQFAYVASHDLQEPLRKIQIFIEFLKQNYNDYETSEKYIQKIQSSAGRMAALIRDVLEYSRLTSEKDLTAEVDLNQIIANVKSDFELLIEERKALIKCEKLPAIKGNALQLHQLFANLINNAIKFSNDQPVITIQSKLLTAEEIAAHKDLDPKLNYICLNFADQGIGFNEQFNDRIFTIFQRLNPRDKYEGTGIGLALCKKIVENHNGYIYANSAPGKGATFTIILPG